MFISLYQGFLLRYQNPETKHISWPNSAMKHPWIPKLNCCQKCSSDLLAGRKSYFTLISPWFQNFKSLNLSAFSGNWKPYSENCPHPKPTKRNLDGFSKINPASDLNPIWSTRSLTVHSIPSLTKTYEYVTKYLKHQNHNLEAARILSTTNPNPSIPFSPQPKGKKKGRKHKNNFSKLIYSLQLWWRWLT